MPLRLEIYNIHIACKDGTNDCGSCPLLSYGDGLYAFNLWMKQFSLMWLASSSASSNPLILIFYFFIYGKLIQKLRQKEVDEESCMKTCSMNGREANSVYTSYIVSSASNGKIQAGALIFVLVGYIVTALLVEVADMGDVDAEYELGHRSYELLVE
ncbi:hypothetical protein Tco_0637373 [Tanacetum coccineum]